MLAATPYLWVLAMPLLPAFRRCLHRRRAVAGIVYGGIAAMVVMTVVDCEMAGVLYRYLMDYSPVLLVGAALCWFCAEGALSRRTAVGMPPPLPHCLRCAWSWLPPWHTPPFTASARCSPWAVAAGAEPFALLHCQPPCSILDVNFPEEYYG